MSLLTFISLFVGDIHPFADVIGAPSIPFFVVVAFGMRDLVRWAMGQTVAAILLAPFAFGGVDFMRLELDAGSAAAPCPCLIWAAGGACRRRGVGWRRCSTIRLPFRFLPFPASAWMPCLHRTFAVRVHRHCCFIFSICGGLAHHQLFKTIGDHVGNAPGLVWDGCSIPLLICGGEGLHDDLD